MTRTSVVLVDLRKVTTHQPTAIARLKDWALADPELRAKADVTLMMTETDVPAERVAAEIAARAPRLVGFSCYVWNIKRALEISSLLKKIDPALIVVLGGPETSPTPEKILKRHAAIDLVALGEGEETFRRLLRHVVLGEGELGSVPGLAHRAADGIVKTEAPPQMDLAVSGSPFLSGTIDDPSPEKNGISTAIMETSRGCPFTCSFCEWGPRNMRYTPLAQVEAEFRLLGKRYSRIELCDSDLLMDKRRGLKVLRLFLDATAGTDSILCFNTNPIFLAPEIADLMAEQPSKFYIFAGLQTTSSDVSDNISRPFDLVRAKRNLDYLARKAPGLVVEIPVIYGLPGDDLSGLRRTLDWAMDMSTGYVHIYHPLVLPGTDMERHAADYGIVYQEEAPHQILETAAMNRKAMGQARALAFYVNIFQVFMRKVDWNAPSDVSAVSLVERWVAMVREAGIDPAMGIRVEEIGPEERFDQMNEAFVRLFASPIDCATLVFLSRTFAQRYGRRPPAERAAPASRRRQAILPRP